jgi:small subunit ribosomal protein S9
MNNPTLAAQHGSRKASVANAYISAGTGKVNVRCSYNKRDLLNMKRQGKDLSTIKKDFLPSEYFETVQAYNAAEFLLAPLVKIGKADKFNITITVKGGGLKSQLEAAHLAIAKALVVIDPSYKPALSDDCRTDARKKERSKIGCRGKARRKVQFSKR